MSVEEVKKILDNPYNWIMAKVGYGDAFVTEALPKTDQIAEQIVSLFSPPPVAGGLGERILEEAEKLLKAYQARVNGETTDEEFKEKVLAFPNSILKIIKEAGYLKLIPDPLKGTPFIKDIAKFCDSPIEDLDD